MEELGRSLESTLQRSWRRLIIGVDANAVVSSVVDFVHVGEGVIPLTMGAMDLQRATAFFSFLCDYGLRLVNTFVDAAAADLVTRSNWSGDGGSTQMDFLACSHALPTRFPLMP